MIHFLGGRERSVSRLHLPAQNGTQFKTMIVYFWNFHSMVLDLGCAQVTDSMKSQITESAVVESGLVDKGATVHDCL